MIRYLAVLLIPLATVIGLKVGYQSEARAEAPVVFDTASADDAKPHRVLAVTNSDGDTYSFHDPIVGGKPILLARFDAGSGPAAAAPSALDAGSAFAPAPAAPATGSATPSDKLRDPVASPQLALDDLKSAKKGGWGIFLFACLIMLCRVLGRLGGIFKPLAQGRAAVVIAGVNTLALTAFNALALDGTWFAVAAAMIVALAAFWDAHAKPREPSKA